MYYYVYDAFLNANKYKKTLDKIEHRLSDLGINGRIGRLSMLKNLNELVRDEYKLGTTNFIAVGDDQTFLQVLNAAAEFDCCIGYIPIGADNYLAQLFGLPPEDLACDVLSGRIVRSIDLGCINNFHFLQSLKIQSNYFTLHCDQSFTIKPYSTECDIDIVNLNTKTIPKDLEKFISVKDGYLNIIISDSSRSMRSFTRLFKRSGESRSFFSVKEIEIKNGQDVKVLVDGYKTFRPPIRIVIKKDQARIIVGKNRRILL